MKTEYIHALADALVAQGRRYGLSANTHTHLVEILSSVPVPCCKETCDKPAAEEMERNAQRPLGHKHQGTPLSAPGVFVTMPQIIVPATAIPVAIPSDEKIAEAVQATADEVISSATEEVYAPLELTSDNVEVEDDKV